VAANAPLRRAVSDLGVAVDVPPPELCTDNAAMIASAARFVDPLRYPTYLGLDVYASGETPAPESGASPEVGETPAAA
jgi:N6-L-threonylcarbamoyladenine synthase